MQEMGHDCPDQADVGAGLFEKQIWLVIIFKISGIFIIVISKIELVKQVIIIWQNSLELKKLFHAFFVSLCCDLCGFYPFMTIVNNDMCNHDRSSRIALSQSIGYRHRPFKKKFGWSSWLWISQAFIFRFFSKSEPIRQVVLFWQNLLGIKELFAGIFCLSVPWTGS